MTEVNKPSIYISGGTDDERIQLRNLVAGLLGDAQGARVRLGYQNLAGLFAKQTLALQHKSIVIDLEDISSEYNPDAATPVNKGTFVVKVILFGETLYLGHDALVGSYRTARQFNKLVEVSNEQAEIQRLVVEYLFHTFPHVEDVPKGSICAVEIWDGIGTFTATQLSNHLFEVVV